MHCAEIILMHCAAETKRTRSAMMTDEIIHVLSEKEDQYHH